LLRFPTLYLVDNRAVIDTDRLMERETLRIGEAAHVLGVSEQTLRRWVERGLLHAWRMPVTGERRFATVVILRMRGQLEHPVVEKIGDQDARNAQVASGGGNRDEARLRP
jgi:excisionase family DNA binding protein